MPGSDQGVELMKEAEKKLKSFSLFGSANKTEAAMELYDKAAAQFKITKDWDQAAECYLKIAELAGKLSNELEEEQAYTNAAKAYKNANNNKEAMKIFKLVAEMRMKGNKFQQAGKLYTEMAQMEEKEMNHKAALELYQSAADCFQADNSASSESQALLKVAELSAMEMDYKTAIEIYEKVSATSLENSLLKYSVKDYMYKASLCQLSICAQISDFKTLEDKLERYKDMNPAWDGDKACAFIEQLIKAFDDGDVEAFSEACFKYNQIYKLDQFATKILSHVKGILKNGPTKGADLGDNGADVDLS